LRSLGELAHWRAEAAQAARDLGGDGTERMQQALDRYAELLEIQRQAGDDRAALTTLGHLAHRAGENGDASLARTRYSELRAQQEHVLGEEHPDTLKTRDHLAHWAGEDGDGADALRQYRELLTDMEREGGPGKDHPETLHVRERIAHWTARSGDPGAAVALYATVVKDQERILGVRHSDTEWSRSQLNYWRDTARRSDRYG
jgi:hypothetical protein